MTANAARLRIAGQHAQLDAALAQHGLQHGLGRKRGLRRVFAPKTVCGARKDLYFGEFVVFGADDARLYVLDTLSGTQKWEYEVGEAIKGGSAVAEGRVFIGTQGGVVYGFESAP